MSIYVLVLQKYMYALLKTQKQKSSQHIRIKSPFIYNFQNAPAPRMSNSLLKANAAPSHLKPQSPELINVSSFKAIGLKCFNELHDNYSTL